MTAIVSFIHLNDQCHNNHDTNHNTKHEHTKLPNYFYCLMLITQAYLPPKVQIMPATTSASQRHL
jgi:hypothetical protein